MQVTRWVSNAGFNLVHKNNLVYNTCWEDPRLDRQALQIGREDTILMITSAGCNALDYALDSPKHIFAVDINPRQNALLELKMAAIRNLEYDDFFSMFGRGRIASHREIYSDFLRADLPEPSRAFWDRQIDFFSARENHHGFFFCGSSGFFARLLNLHIDRLARVRDGINAMLESKSVAEQKAIYDEQIRGTFWNLLLRWALGRDAVLSLVGVPQSQRRQIEQHFPGGMADFVEQCIEYVFSCLPFSDNYFWRVYLTGEYTRDCCPEYLKEENFLRLKSGLVDRISTYTTTIEAFLNQSGERVSRFILLDHMDWLSAHRLDLLQAEWQAIVNRAAAKARIIWRSGGMQVDYVDPLRVVIADRSYRLADRLHYHDSLAAGLHALDRVGTYGSFYIADLT